MPQTTGNLTPGQLPPGLDPQLDDQLPDQRVTPTGSYKSPNAPQVFYPDPPTPNGVNGSVLTTRQCAGLVPKRIG